MAHTRFDEETVVEIRERYDKDRSITQTELAQEYGTNQTRIWEILNGRKFPDAGGPILTEHGNVGKTHDLKLDEEDRDKIKEMHENGKSQSEIARELGVTQPAVRYRLVKMGLLE